MAENSPQDATKVVSGPPSASALPQVPDHKLLRCIGRGAYGEVWLARNVMGTYRAVKVVWRKSFETERPYEREFAGIQKFEPISRSHEGLVDILHVGRNDEAGYFFYVMELADDVANGAQIEADQYEPKTLEREIRRRGRLSVEECLPVSLSLTNGLAYLHEQGLVHRDIKPSNIIFVNGAPKLADIGLVCGTEGTQSYVGTEGYIPPEGPGTPQADLYSVGKVFYEMSTGKDRQEFPNLQTDLRANAEQHDLVEFNEVLLKACAPNVRDRYQSAREMESELSLLQIGKSVRQKRKTKQRWAMARLAAGIAVIAAILFISLLFVKKEYSGRTASSGEPRSIAVIPFTNLTSEKDSEYLAEGITGEIINALMGISGLRVVKGGNVDISKMATQLKVPVVLEGTVQKTGNRLRITARIQKLSDNSIVWSAPYDYEMKDLLRVQSEVAQQVAAALKIQLGVGEKQRLARKPTANVDAYLLYLKGRYFFQNRGAPGMLDKASESFTSASTKDPNFAEAYAGLADCFAVRGSWEYGDLSPKIAFPEATRLAQKALRIYDLAEAHATLGYAYLHHYWRWDEAEKEFRKALELDPKYDNAHHWYAHYLLAMGRDREAFEHSQEYLQHSPTDPLAYIHLAWHHQYTRQYDSAITACKSAIDLRPEFAWGHFFLGWAYEQKSMFGEAIAEFQKATERSEATKNKVAALGHAYAIAGKTNDALQAIEQLKKVSRPNDYVPPFEIAVIHAGLGDKANAFIWLQKAFDEGSGWMAYLNVEPRLDPLRDDPRFTKLLKDVGLPLPAQTNSIAVLRFINENLSSENEYLAEGIPDRVTAVLDQIPGLKVAPRSQAFAFKGNELPRRIGDHLNVRTLLEGSVRKVAEKFYVTVQLINTETENQFWSQPYHPEMKDFPALPSVIASDVAQALKIPLGVETTQRVIKKQTESPDAWHLYVIGRVNWNHRAEGKLKTAQEAFQRAREIDPAFALAYSGLADSYSSQVFTYDAGSLSPIDGMPKAQWAANRAIELEPALAECLTSQAFVKLIYDWNWSEAGQGFTNALARNRNYAHAHHWHSHYLMAMGQTNASLAESQKALELEPGDFIINIHLGWHYLFTRDSPSALKQFQVTSDMYPENPLSHRYLGLAYEQLKNYRSAIVEFERAVELSSSNSIMLGGLGHTLATAGDKPKARQVLEQLKAISKERFVSPYYMALIHTGLGENEEAFHWLDEALSQKCDALIYLDQDPWLDSLRGDSHFDRLVQAVGLQRQR